MFQRDPILGIYFKEFSLNYSVTQIPKYWVTLYNVIHIALKKMT
jgi:hypothetical protein